MNIFEVMHRRRSVRQYANQPLPGETLGEIRGIIERAEGIDPEIGVDIHIIDREQSREIVTGLIGSYGKVVAPHYMVVTAEEKEGCREHAGYLVEQIVLRLALLGIGTCWIGGGFKRGVITQHLPLKSNHIPLVLIAFGTPEKENGHLRQPEDAKRLPLSQIVRGSMDETWRRVMEAVRLAPSAVNSQPWRFVFEGDQIHVFAAKPEMFLMKKVLEPLNRLDMGIALCHLALGAEHIDKEITFTKLNVAPVKDWRYLLSVVIR